MLASPGMIGASGVNERVARTEMYLRVLSTFFIVIGALSASSVAAFETATNQAVISAATALG